MKEALLHWTMVKSGTNGDFFAIASSGSTFVAAGDDISSSNDGINWTIGNPQGANIYSAAWGGGVFVLIGCQISSNKMVILNSSDGMSWNTLLDPFNLGSCSGQAYHICFGNGLFDMGGFVYWGEGEGVLYYFESNDGTSWQQQEIPNWPVGGDPILVARDGPVLAIATPLMLDVPLGPSYQDTLGSSNQLTPTALCVGKGKILIGAWCNNPADTGIWTTTDCGITLNLRVATSSIVRQIAFLGDSFIAVGDNGLILVSDDGVTWTTVPSGTNINLMGVAVGDSRVVIVGEQGTILVSDPLDSIYLSLSFKGTCHGAVLITPPGLLAKKAVTVHFPAGTSITLSARPRLSKGDLLQCKFAGWRGGITGTNPDRKITLLKDLKIMAVFNR